MSCLMPVSYTHLDVYKRQQYDRAVWMLKAGIELSYQQANAIYRSDLLQALSRCYEAVSYTHLCLYRLRRLLGNVLT